jgi:hypothetical protein
MLVGKNGQSTFDGIFCRVNGSEIDLRGSVFETTKYLTWQARRLSRQSVATTTSVAFVLGLCFMFA